MIMVGLVGGVSYHHHRRCLAWILEFAISHKYGLVRWMTPRTELCPPPVPDRTRSGPPIFSAYILTSSQHEDHIFSYRITTYH